MFSTPPTSNFSFCIPFILLSANALNLGKSTILFFGKELNQLNQNRNFTRKELTKVFNSLPNAKISDHSKLKALAEKKINVAQKRKFVFRRVENIARKGENAVYQDFLLFPKMISKASFSFLFLGCSKL